MIRIKKQPGSINTTIQLTPSKSITNRVLIIQALAKDKFEIVNQSTSDDSVLLDRILNNLDTEINAGDAGTAYRFLTAFLSIQEGEFVLTGSKRMFQRPIGPLVSALKNLGAVIEYLEKEGFPPLKIKGRKLEGGRIRIDANESSQFVSALIMIAPYMKTGLDLEIKGENSRPYIMMTISLMEYFGINIQTDDNRIQIKPQEYSGKSLTVENDWSAASFLYEIAAQAENAEIILKGLNLNSIQGDSVISTIMESFGITSKFINGDVIINKNHGFIQPTFFKYNFTSCPDLVIPIAAICTALKIPAELTGVRNLKIKESNRLEALKMELEKTGASVNTEIDSIKIIPPFDFPNEISFNSHNDHRMVMALASLSMTIENIEIDDELPVSKSYPEFWVQFLH